MRKSISGFILGLLGAVACLFVSIGFLFVGAVVDGTDTVGLLTIFGWLSFVGSILGIVGCSLCFKKARFGGVLLLLATVLCCSYKVYSLSIVDFSTYLASSVGMLSLVFSLIPLLLLFIASICALSARKTSKKVNKYVYARNR